MLPALPPSATSSARVETEPNAAPLNSLSVTLAKLGAVDPATNPPAQTENTPPPEGNFSPPGAGSRRMPDVDGIQWEHKTDGSIEAWHSPEGKRNRGGKVYLGRLGVRRLAELLAMTDDARRALVVAWIAEKRAAKGIE